MWKIVHRSCSSCISSVQEIDENSIGFSLSTQTWSRFKLPWLEPYINSILSTKFCDGILDGLCSRRLIQGSKLITCESDCWWSMSQVSQDCGTDKLQVSSLSALYELFVAETQLHIGLT